MINQINYSKSKYNIFVPYNESEFIIYNSLSGSIGKFDLETYKRYKENQLKESEIDKLLEKGILIPDSFDELNKIHNDRLCGILNDTIKHYRIWPTSACNAKCYYCFEKGVKQESMSKDVADATINFIERGVSNKDTIKIEWFGGEPLLNIDIIDYVFLKLKNIRRKKDNSIYTTMITNGSLINTELSKKIKDMWDLKLIQITLDGYGDAYDRVKNYSNPHKFNFKNTIDSIELLANSDIHITIRMNYDTNNFESLIELINFLHYKFAEYKNISYYIYPVWSSIEQNRSNSFLSTTIADKNLLSLFDLLVKYGMSTPKKVAGLTYKKYACQAWSKNSYTILPNGDISKCAESYNRVIGNVWDGVINQEEYAFWINNTLNDSCTECIYLPICQGGCKASFFSRMPQCFALKPIFNDLLIWYVKHMDSRIYLQNQNKI